MPFRFSRMPPRRNLHAELFFLHVELFFLRAELFFLHAEWFFLSGMAVC